MRPVVFQRARSVGVIPTRFEIGRAEDLPDGTLQLHLDSIPCGPGVILVESEAPVPCPEKPRRRKKALRR